MEAFGAKRMKDATGKRLRVGDMVRICGVPDLSAMSTRYP